MKMVKKKMNTYNGFLLLFTTLLSLLLVVVSSDDDNNIDDDDDGMIHDVSSRIFGGHQVSRDTYKWFVRIGNPNPDKSLWCGATLVSYDTILSAAHCGYDEIIQYRNQIELWGAPGARGIIIEKKIHPRYNPDTFEYDFMLLKIQWWNVNYPTPSDYIDPIELSVENVDSYVDLTIIGQGMRETGSFADPGTLYTAVVKYIDYNRCNQAYKGFINGELMICGADDNPNTKIDTCGGDSGGPILNTIGQQVGLTSFGPTDCASESLAGVYARISAVITNWIRPNICQMTDPNHRPWFCDNCPLRGSPQRKVTFVDNAGIPRSSTCEEISKSYQEYCYHLDVTPQRSPQMAINDICTYECNDCSYQTDKPTPFPTPQPTPIPIPQQEPIVLTTTGSSSCETECKLSRRSIVSFYNDNGFEVTRQCSRIRFKKSLCNNRLVKGQNTGKLSSDCNENEAKVKHICTEECQKFNGCASYFQKDGINVGITSINNNNNKNKFTLNRLKRIRNQRLRTRSSFSKSKQSKQQRQKRSSSLHHYERDRIDNY